MIVLFFFTFLTSLSAYAANSELEAIYKKYELSQMNFKVGMKSVSISKDSEVEGVIEITTAILKVDGTKVYEYVVDKDLITGEVWNARVELSDYKYSNDDRCDFKNIQIHLDVLSYDYTCLYDYGYSTHKSRGIITRNLLSSAFCGHKNHDITKITYPSSDEVELVKLELTKECDGFVTISDLKKIDLTHIRFCDSTLPDTVDCETKDMSYLTSEL